MVVILGGTGAQSSPRILNFNSVFIHFVTVGIGRWLYYDL
jgi:hypothetical protein